MASCQSIAVLISDEPAQQKRVLGPVFNSVEWCLSVKLGLNLVKQILGQDGRVFTRIDFVLVPSFADVNGVAQKVMQLPTTEAAVVAVLFVGFGSNTSPF